MFHTQNYTAFFFLISTPNSFYFVPSCDEIYVHEVIVLFTLVVNLFKLCVFDLFRRSKTFENNFFDLILIISELR